MTWIAVNQLRRTLREHKQRYSVISLTNTTLQIAFPSENSSQRKKKEELEKASKEKVREFDGSNSKFIEEEDSKFINVEGSSGVKNINIDGLRTSVAVHDYPCYGLHAMQRSILVELINAATSTNTTTTNTVVANPCFFSGYTRLVAKEVLSCT